jgi:hypothetical protein
VRFVIAIGAVLRTGDSLIAVGLLTAAVLLSPPRDGVVSTAVVLVAAITCTGVALHAIRKASVQGIRFARLGAWARATAALGVSASILMIFDATVAAVG